MKISMHGDGVFLCPRGGTGYRRAVAASPAGRNLEAGDPGAERGWLIKGLWRNRRAFAMVLGFTAAGSLTFYTFTTYMQKYLVNTAGMTASTASVIMTAALFVYMLVQPLFGAFSDKVGRRTSMLCFGVLATLFTVPILSALQKVSSPYAAFGFGDLRLTDCQFLYLDQRHPESRDVPGSGSRAWGRVVLCRRERIVRRLCGVRRAVA